MLKTAALHPEILAALGRAGHLSTVLISDGNYPHATKPNPRAPIVWANFRPGLLGVVEVLEMLCDLVPIETATVMEPERTGAYAMSQEPPIWSDFRRVLRERAGFTEPLTPLQKPQFHALAAAEDVALVIATAETQIFANLLLTIGVVR
jgi:L-fucose mutarotase